MNLQKELMQRIKEERKVHVKDGVPAYDEVNEFSNYLFCFEDLKN